jgi:protocadherin alpha
LGFGAFVDKRVAPYVSIVPNTLIDPCGANCEGPYSFRHVISLVNDSDQFNQGIQDREISGNLDSPEGGFDGFIQSIVCQDLIGWRDNARHLLLYITDAGFHYAGDGKLGGAIIPNKGECLMPQLNGSFVDYQEYYRIDYPSIGQIRQRLREFDIIPLFASAQGARPFYDALAEELSSEGADVGTLADDSSNVVTLIQESYQRVSQRIIISPDNIPGLTFNVTPVVCPIIDGSECNGVQIEQEVQFNITASLLQCNTELTSSPTLVNFRVLGFGSFQVEVESLCSCECERNEEPNSQACTNGNGTLSCGTCLCNQGRFGEICQCGNNGLTSEGNSTRCSDGPNGLQCSGRGRCVCGQCDCEKFDDGREFFGVTCECDNFQCDRDPLNNLVCGGPNRGICSCNGQCNCLNSPLSGLQYTGSACDCSPDNNTCINPTNTQSECSNNGRCECGACICNEGYIGEFCQTCIDINVCPVASCETNRLCAQCGTGVTTEGCEVCGSNVTMITDVGVEHTIEGNQATTCDFTDENGCEYRYFVALDPNGVPLPLEVDQNVVCPIRVEPWIIAIIVIAALLILGILILAAIKIILMLLDYVEVKKFMKDVQNPEFRKNENPLYLKAEKDYPNPTYGK